MLVFLFLLHCVFAAVCSINDPSACDELSKELAFGFSCDDAQSDECLFRMNQQLVRLAHADYPGLDGLIAASRSAYMSCGGDDKRSNTGALFCPPRFLGPMMFARLPSSVEQARALNASLIAYQKALDPFCGLEWALKTCADGVCPPPNSTCQKEHDFTLLLREAVRMALFFAAKREHKHLMNMNVSCVTQSSSECSLFVTARLAESSRRITELTPKTNDKVRSERQKIVCFLNFFFCKALLVPLSFVNTLWKRPCGSDLPCPKEVLDPILASTSESELSRALDFANTILEAVLPQNMEDEFLKILSQPAAPCNKIEEAPHIAGALTECPAASRQALFVIFVNLTSQSIESRLTPKFKSRLSGLISSCWFGCRLLLEGQRFSIEREFFPEVWCEKEGCLLN